MSDIFNSRPGVVAIVGDPDSQALPGRVSVDGLYPAAAIISGIDYGQQTNQQFQTSLDSSIYLYVFGDSMGEIVVHGKAFPAVCGDDNANDGLKEIFDFYAEQRASKQPTPVSVQIGAEVIVGFLTSLKVHGNTFVDDPTSFMADFALGISALPRT